MKIQFGKAAVKLWIQTNPIANLLPKPKDNYTPTPPRPFVEDKDDLEGLLKQVRDAKWKKWQFISLIIITFWVVALLLQDAINEEYFDHSNPYALLNVFGILVAPCFIALVAGEIIQRVFYPVHPVIKAYTKAFMRDQKSLLKISSKEKNLSLALVSGTEEALKTDAQEALASLTYQVYKAQVELRTRLALKKRVRLSALYNPLAKFGLTTEGFTPLFNEATRRYEADRKILKGIKVGA